MEQRKELNLSLLPNVDNILQFKPRGTRIIIKPAPELEIKSAGGIILTEKSVEERRRLGLSSGEIITKGSQCSEETQVGQKVFFAWDLGQGMVRSNDDVYLIFEEYNIVAYEDTPVLTVQGNGEIVEKK